MMECRQLWAGVTVEIGARRTNIIINIALDSGMSRCQGASDASLNQMMRWCALVTEMSRGAQSDK